MSMKRPLYWILAAAGLALTLGTAKAEDRDAKVRNDQAAIKAGGFWIYNDVEKGFAEAKRTGKPLLVVFRCVP